MTLWEEITKELDKQVEDLKNLLAYGGSSSYDEYRQVVGRIEGLQLAKEQITNIVKIRIYEEE